MRNEMMHRPVVKRRVIGFYADKTKTVNWRIGES